MSRILHARRFVLAVTGLVFLLIAAGSLLNPHAMAEPLGYSLTSSTALNEFRAIYVGLWAVHTVIFTWAAWRIEHLALGDVCGLLLLGQVVGRLVSVLLDGLPQPSIAAPAAAELVGALLVFTLRPRSGRHRLGP